MGHHGSLLQATVIFLLAVVLLVPLAQRVKLGAVPGYLLVGVLIGPSVLGFINNSENVSRLSEMGVVLLLFVIGLELSPRKLWMMRRLLFGVGLLQVVLTGAIFAAIAFFAFAQTLQASVVLGLALALSSTAFGLQILAEHKELGRPHGRMAVAILLFQDIAAIPLIAVIPLLATVDPSQAQGGELRQLLTVLGAIGAIIVGGRFLLRPVFGWAVIPGLRELSTAVALLSVLGTAWLMEHAGVSMALGAFLAGLLMAESPFRHELESQIEPFKGLLLGLFFVGVGMTADLRLLFGAPWVVLGLTVLLVAIKLPLLFGLGRLTGGLNRADAIRLGVVLASGGEFAFVVFKLALEHRLLDQSVHDLLVLVITLSMAMIPLLMIALSPLMREAPAVSNGAQNPPDISDEPQVVIAGMGRMGRVIARMLHARGISMVALDTSVQAIDQQRKSGHLPVYYGDPTRPEILHAAKVETAQLVIVATDDPQINLDTARTIGRLYPGVKVIARARDRQEALKLMDAGARPIRETFHSSLEITRRALLVLGESEGEVNAWTRQYRKQDEDEMNHRHRDTSAAGTHPSPATDPSDEE
ncbi:monovalent cation:proton antiporter-2 (CPA2) family protein [Pseudomonas putida]|uniref:monovalent cation:proton antiporter-2 (CPA2) family protein n=1 Tax=Pseudomonas putida TaxID=303 RepID=UPI003D95DE18